MATAGEQEDDVIESGPPGPRHPRVRRLVVAVLVVAVAAGLIYQSRQDDQPSAADTPTPTPTPTRVAPSSRPVDRVYDDHLLGVTRGWELFARGPRSVVRIEPARGRVTTTALPPLRSSGPVSFLVGTDRALVRPLDDVPGYAVPDTGPARDLPPGLDHGGVLLPGPVTGQVWARMPRTPARMSLLTMDGTKIGPSIPVPPTGWPMPDGGGYVLYGDLGGVYQSSPRGLRWITTGTVLASGPTGWLVSRCDPVKTCTRTVVDRATRTRRVLPGARRDDGAGGPIGNGVIAPDGSYAAVPVDTEGGGDDSQIRVIDLETGAERSAAGTSGTYLSPTVWSPDSRWILTTSAFGDLAAIDPATGRGRDVGVRLPTLTQVAVRPES